MRVRIAASAPPMVIAGNTRCAIEPEPDTGSHPNSIAKNKIRIGPSAKFGNDNPSSETKLSTRSSQRLRRKAERTPAGIDSASATISAASVSSMVAGYACAMMCPTFWFMRSDFPMSPCRMPRQ